MALASGQSVEISTADDGSVIPDGHKLYTEKPPAGQALPSMRCLSIVPRLLVSTPDLANQDKDCIQIIALG